MTLNSLILRAVGLVLGAALLSASFPANAGENVEPASAEAGKFSHGADACTAGESWVYGGSVLQSQREQLERFLHGAVAPVRAFSEALALRRFARGAEAKWLGEYWISRALLEAKLTHIAFTGFANIAARPVKAETAGIQLSALECMLAIRERYPAINLPASVTQRIAALQTHAGSPQALNVTYRAASAALQSQPEKTAEFLRLLKGSGPYEDFAVASRAASAGDHNAVIAALGRFLAAPALPPELKRDLDSAHLLMARSLYSLQQYDRAASHFRQVSKSSNQLATALEELAWAQIMNDRLTDAIGSAVTLQAGGLRHTFAPEAPMVMAMALNELCQYPESVHAIGFFRKNYQKAYEWLQTGITGNLYRLAVQYVRKAPGLAVPGRVASEWVRSPLFISSQEELNLLVDEKDSTVALGKSGSKEQAKLALELLEKSKDLPRRLEQAKAKMKEGDHLPPRLTADLLELKEMILHYRRLQQGAPVWHAILANYRKSAASTQNKLLSNINSDLKRRSQRMLAQLEEISENIQLIEVEIYNGASQDIIWQNAHPDFDKIARQLQDKIDGSRASRASKTWDWGRGVASLDDDGTEIWEDELGSFSANLRDNCESKDKYLALKAGGGGRL